MVILNSHISLPSTKSCRDLWPTLSGSICHLCWASWSLAMCTQSCLGLRDTSRGSDSQQLLLLVYFLGGGLLPGALPSHPKLQLCSLGRLLCLQRSHSGHGAHVSVLLLLQEAYVPLLSGAGFWCYSFYGCFQWVFYLRHKLFNMPKNRDLLVIVFSHVGLWEGTRVPLMLQVFIKVWCPCFGPEIIVLDTCNVIGKIRPFVFFCRQDHTWFLIFLMAC